MDKDLEELKKTVEEMKQKKKALNVLSVVLYFSSCAAFGRACGNILNRRYIRAILDIAVGSSCIIVDEGANRKIGAIEGLEASSNVVINILGKKINPEEPKNEE